MDILNREILFIGHANPEDNDFTMWLQAKLTNEGYQAACDLTFLLGGEEDYWKSLQEILEHRSIRYLLVLSRATFTKQGVIDEWEQVKSIAKKFKILDFIQLVKIDDVPFDVRIGTNVKNHFRFDISWAAGLKQLLKKLAQDGIPRSSNTPLSVDDWTKNRFSTSLGVVEKTQLYYSNWLNIPAPPEKMYFYQYVNATQAEAVEKSITKFPVIRHDHFIISFSPTLPTTFPEHEYEIPFAKWFTVPTSSALENDPSINFPVFADRKRFLVRLLKTAWIQFLLSKGLQSFDMSQRTRCFFYKKDQLDKDKVFFTYGDRRTYKQLVGDFREAMWHYAMSATVLLAPTVCFSLKAHLLFSDDGQVIWTAARKLHRARRSKGKSFFNDQWRGLMLAFLASIADENNVISMRVSEQDFIHCAATTAIFTSIVDYEEPPTNARMVPIDFEEDDDEDGDDIPQLEDELETT